MKNLHVYVAVGVITVSCALGLATADRGPTQVDINLLAGQERNTVDACSTEPVPITIFGSERVDVTAIPQHALTLEGPYIAGTVNSKTLGSPKQSRVTSPDVVCKVDDIGSFDPDARDNFGRADGHDDLICEFSLDRVELFVGRQQHVSVRGYLRNPSGEFDPIQGIDLLLDPTVLESTTVCCIDCTDGSCIGCSTSGFENCNGEYASCDKQEEGNDWSGCTGPPIC